MEASQFQRDTLKQQYQKLSIEVFDQVQQVTLLRGRLKAALSPFQASLRCRLNHRPGPPSSSYWPKFQAYWDSFELFKEKLAIVLQHLSLPFETPMICSARPVTDTEAGWADIVDDLEEQRDTLQLQRAQRAAMLLLIDLLNSIDRLSRLRIPQASNKGKGRTFTDSIYTLQRNVRILKCALEQTLFDHDIHPIALSLGQYPPPETTRIIARRDNNTDDDVIIVEIAMAGYTWRTRLLRKADVIVASSTRSMN